MDTDSEDDRMAHSTGAPPDVRDGAPRPTGLQIWLQSGMTKHAWGHVRSRRFNPSAMSSIRVVAARNEVVSFQLLLEARENFVVTLDSTNWLHALGHCPRARVELEHSLPPSAVEAFIVGYVEGDDRQDWMEYLDGGGHTEVGAAVDRGVRAP